MEITFKYSMGVPTDAMYIREEVFMKEQGFEDEFDDIDATAHHVVLYVDDKPVGTARTFPEGEYYMIGRVAVLASMRKHHLGKQIMEAIEKKIMELGGTKIALSAQVRVQGFYESLGYKPLGDEYLDEHCPHIKMIKAI